MKTVFLCPQSDKALGLFRDIENNPDAIVKYTCYKYDWYRILMKIVYVLKRWFQIDLYLPNFMFDYNIDSIIGANNISRIVVRSNVLEIVPISYLQSARSKGIRCELLLLDSMDAGSHTINKRTVQYMNYTYWDDIVTFDPVDAKRYGFSFNGFNYYSKMPLTETQRIVNDIYYIGSLKGGRGTLINDVYNYLTSNAVKCRFDMRYSNSRDRKKYNQNINWIRKSIPYSNVLKNVSESNCILEILQNNQAGPSLRFFEAVIYNKKLLTNNCHIVDFPYYNPQYMKIFKGTDDIDIEWLLDNSINVEYNYKGDFSPLHMLH